MNYIVNFRYKDASTGKAMAIVTQVETSTATIMTQQKLKALEAYCKDNITYIENEVILNRLKDTIAAAMAINRRVKHPETIIAFAILDLKWKPKDLINSDTMIKDIQNIIEIRQIGHEDYGYNINRNILNSNQITNDNGIVIYDRRNNKYLTGASSTHQGNAQWDKQLRKAKIYHSMKYAQEAIDKLQNPKLGLDLDLIIHNISINIIG